MSNAGKEAHTEASMLHACGDRLASALSVHNLVLVGSIGVCIAGYMVTWGYMITLAVMVSQTVTGVM